MAFRRQWNVSLPASYSLRFFKVDDPCLPRWIQSPSLHREKLTQSFGGNVERHKCCSLQRPQIVNRLISLTLVLVKGHNPRVPDQPQTKCPTHFFPSPSQVHFMNFIKGEEKTRHGFFLLSLLLLTLLPLANTLLAFTEFKKCYKQNC